MDILILADIHGNFTALKAIDRFFQTTHFDMIINCGDSTVYGPFPNETISWLKKNNVYTILGNTDRKITKLLKGKTFHKPKKEEKRIMYTWTRDVLTSENRRYLLSCEDCLHIDLSGYDPLLPQTIRVHHGSPDNPDEFLFDNTSTERFLQLAESLEDTIVLTGHSHTPYYKCFSSVHFINPGSVGRMFDGNPRGSCATLNVTRKGIKVQHYRIQYRIQEVVDEIRKQKLPDIYSTMFLLGKKLN